MKEISYNKNREHSVSHVECPPEKIWLTFNSMMN